ncbi:DNA helicase RecQ [Natroniella acetigena]|uniref:DNA helicase RecQ n=1 Tax=Natroniella acetigena TaxID=52004 RepID=UPI00200B861F|nr:DNA helicase RecQ [Natroniella acetigena]MCK8827377.1 DNA helicase RecQ [Natroniella acetigena]
MLEEAEQLLQEYFGYSSFRKGQQEIIGNILAGNNTLGIMPTGGGKSICFQIPSLCLAGITLVISPLISLMKDQIDSLNALGIAATFINSSLSNLEIKERMAKTCEGQYDLLYIAPERLQSKEFIAQLQAADISLIAVDESHCISSWGHDFRPSYRLIPKLISNLSNQSVVTAFTATATKEVRMDISDLLGIEEENIYVTGFDRPNLKFNLISGENKKDFIAEYVDINQDDAGIIYAATRKEVDQVTSFLKQKGFSVGKYHAGLSNQERRIVQEKFIFDELKIIVATNAFGMGIDKSNVRYVIHHNLPQTLEDYYQEAGRAGRDGEPSECILLFHPADMRLPKFFIEESNLTPQLKERRYQKLQKMIDYCYTSKCLRGFILNYFDNQQLIAGCDNCSNCNEEQELVDITTEAQQILSCVYKTDQRFGITTVACVLKGSKRQKILKLGFDQLSTYGLLRKHTIKEIKDLINFLIAEGYIRLTNSKFPVTKLTAKAKPVLAGREEVYYKVRKKIKRITSQNSLFSILREFRMKLAKKEDLPPYVIFHDSTLKEMAHQKPLTKEAMLEIKGVGPIKFQRYGKHFLEKIKKFALQETAKQEVATTTDNPSHLISYNLLQEGKTLSEIANLRGLAVTTVQNHLVRSLREGFDLNLDLFISQEKRGLIKSKIKEVGAERLKPLKEALPEEISYFQIKLVIFANNN